MRRLLDGIPSKRDYAIFLLAYKARHNYLYAGGE